MEMYSNIKGLMWIDFEQKCVKICTFSILHQLVRVLLHMLDNLFLNGTLMQRGRVEAESITHKYYNSSTKPKFYKNTRLIYKIIEKISLVNFYSKTHIT